MSASVLLVAEPIPMDSRDYNVMERPAHGSSGRPISLLANHFKVSTSAPDKIVYQYSVVIISEDGRAIKSKAMGRKILNQLYLTYSSEFSGKHYAYDGDQVLYTVGPLQRSNFQLEVKLEESFSRRGLSAEPAKKVKLSVLSRVFKVEISFSKKISLRSVAAVSFSSEAEETQDVLRALDTILRQQAANRGCLLVRQSYFKNDSQDSIDIGGGVTALRGFHSSFHLTKVGVSLNMDVAATLVLKPGPVLDFLLANQNVQELRHIDWGKAKQTLKSLRVRTIHTNMEFKIFSISDKPCHHQCFSLRIKNDESKEEQTSEITVFDYFTKHHGVELSRSKYMPCLDVGRKGRPVYLPVELCELVALQRYKRALTPVQKASLVQNMKLKPQQRSKCLTDAVVEHHFVEEPLLKACSISIQKQFLQLEARVLEVPKLKGGRGKDIIPSNGRWTFKNDHLLSPVEIQQWATVNFSSHIDTSEFCRRLINCGMAKGMHIDRPYALVEEDQRLRKASPILRVDEMFKKLTDKLPGEPQFILCVLPEQKSSDLYGPWKCRSLTKYGVITQCVSPLKITEQYLSNVLLKINAKLGGVNSLLAAEQASRIPLINDTPTMIVGMVVSHSSDRRSGTPSIAAVVGSLFWPQISRYRAAVGTQPPNVDIIESLFKPSAADNNDMRGLLKDFYSTSNGRKPKQIIIFRHGVCEQQFGDILNVELVQVIQAYRALGEKELPKFTVIVSQKNHHTKFFQAGSPDNVPPGTVVDTNIVHPTNYDFYLCAHGGMGTLRPTHYHVLLDEIGFSPDQLQNFINSLSYVNQRSSYAISVVAPIHYARLAAAQVAHLVKAEGSSVKEPDSTTTTENGLVPELPTLLENVFQSMYFC